MANAFPVFPQFDADSNKTTAGARWVAGLGDWKTYSSFLKLVVADDADQGAAKLIDDRKRALLLHYGGEGTYDIYEAHKGDTELTYNGTKKVLSDYFKPRKNTQMEVYTFRCCKQKDGQSLDEFVT